MMGFVYKDFMVLRKQARYYLIFTLLYSALVVGGMFDYGVLAGLIVLEGMMLPMSSFSYDELARWDKYAAATPAGRKKMVDGKYVFALLAILISTGAVFLCLALLALTGIVEAELPEIAAVILICAGVTLLMDTLTLPILIRFGAEKARMISMILFVAVFGGIMLLNSLDVEQIALPTPPEWVLTAAPALVLLLSVLLFFVSNQISKKILAGKEL